MDNGYPTPVGGHEASRDTQTDWNGIIGRIELAATDALSIESARVSPEPERKTTRLRIEIGNSSGKAAAGSLSVDGDGLRTMRAPARIEGGRQWVDIELPLGNSP